MGVQRQLKVLGIFARLCHRDGKTGYVEDMPLVMRYCAARAGAIASSRRCCVLLDALEDRAPRGRLTLVVSMIDAR